MPNKIIICIARARHGNICRLGMGERVRSSKRQVLARVWGGSWQRRLGLEQTRWRVCGTDVDSDRHFYATSSYSTYRSNHCGCHPRGYYE